MPLSKLQRYILKKGLESRHFSVSKKVLLDFYAKEKNPPNTKDQIGIITKSVERLINRRLIRGYGIKTAEKWFISQVTLTLIGRKQARELLGKQEKLPFKYLSH